jgi:hypothetical protein
MFAEPSTPHLTLLIISNVKNLRVVQDNLAEYIPVLPTRFRGVVLLRNIDQPWPDALERTISLFLPTGFRFTSNILPSVIDCVVINDRHRQSGSFLRLGKYLSARVR